MKQSLNLSYSAIQGTYWMNYGAIMSFASVFLLGKNYTNSEIGMIIAAASILAVVIQPLLADAADRSSKVSLTDISGFITVGLIAATASLYFFTARTLVLSVIFVMIAAWLTSLQPLIYSMAFYLGRSGHRINFGVTRSAGSVAYAVFCALLGPLVAILGVNVIPAASIVVLILLLISLAVTGKLYKRAISAGPADPGVKTAAQDGETIGLKAFVTRNKFFIVFTVGVVFVFFQNSVLNTYLLQVVTAVGGTSGQMGRLYAFMALLELPGLIWFSRLRKKFSCQSMLKFASAAFIGKVFLTYAATSVAFIYGAFLLQLVSFPIFLTASVHLVDEVMEKGEAVKGQAFITGMFTLSNVFASLLGGVILDHSGAPLLLLVSTALCAMGTLIVFVTVGKIRPKGDGR
ncbi:MAG TPA: MFS transporter [Anaerovoracaceae bacterium]|nr:MFS transporter [Anaerovoracaceae bacterium]